jgi:hypothetical protein
MMAAGRLRIEGKITEHRRHAAGSYLERLAVTAAVP